MLFKSGTPLTRDERELIYQYIHKGWSCAHIAIKLGRSKNGITAEVRKNGGRVKYDPDKAEEEAQNRKKLRIRNLRYAVSENKQHHLTNDQRIENMQMQIDIILEMVKKLKDKS
jgi:IS30 family transposase